MMLILFAAGLILGTRFTVFVLVPFGVAITIACLAWGLVSPGSVTLLAWAAYIAALNFGFLLGGVFRRCLQRCRTDDKYASHS
ncbi:hypothetical protein GTW25_14900 [Aliihoeflea aestuarii]|uniref:hypothetical protein n=1 Tax=Aliihoeflea aestuarii TaxID=453840 RepID=UPI0020949517|nr:hypothetical protein [Aliihoeflea aestuarii]MCO6392318.1 hypothetical protein [Aliihoeflea aestuarii]